MIKSVFVPLTGFDSDHAALECAIAVAKNFDAQVQCVHIRLDTESALAFATTTTSWKIERVEGEHSQKAHAAFEDARKQHSLPADAVGMAKGGASIRWREVEGFPLPETVHRGRFCDLLVVARDANLLPERIADIIMRTGRPVIVAPAKAPDVVGQSIAVAWKDTPESARALAVAMPFLRKAKKVLLVSVQEEPDDGERARRSLDELRSRLSLHGIDAQALVLTEAPVSVTETLQTAIYNAGCDLLVMGVYGHSRLRELVFGGVTQDMLTECAIPILAFH